MYGISVKMQINTAGMAMAKSKAMDFARVLSADFLTVVTKKTKTSNSGTPLKPGNTMRLLMLRI